MRLKKTVRIDGAILGEFYLIFVKYFFLFFLLNDFFLLLLNKTNFLQLMLMLAYFHIPTSLVHLKH